MPSEKLVVRPEEIELVKPETHAPPTSFQPPPSAIPLWAKFALSPLVLVLPVLCIVAVVLRIAFRAEPPRLKYAWSGFLTTLLAISGLLSTAAAVVVYSFVPIPAIVNTGLPNLDERTDYPTLPSRGTLTSSDASSQLKPLVIVVSPTTRLWNRQEVASQALGAGMLLQSNKDGYLFATANHVVNGKGIPTAPAPAHVMVSLATGLWSTADVIANSSVLDLALLWIPRHSGQADFVQPLSTANDGEDVFVIGHPEGLKYTLSTGIVSGLRDESLQISAAISPGNSGGPVYDSRGQLLGIVSSKFDHNADLNAENLGFATRSDALKDPSRWSFQANGKAILTAYIHALQIAQNTVRNQMQDQDSQTAAPSSH